MANEKFCASCGAKLAEGAKFCASCGAKQPDVAVATAEEKAEAVAACAPVAEAVEQAKETAEKVEQELEGGATTAGFDGANIKKFIPFAAIGAGLIALIIAAVVIVTSLTKYTKINPEELCRITFDGVEGKAVPYVSFAFDEVMTITYENAYQSAVYSNEYASDEDKVDPLEEGIEAVLGIDSKDYKTTLETLGVKEKDLKEKFKEEYGDLKMSDYLVIDEDDLLDAFKKAKDEDEALDMRDAILENVTFEIDFDEEKDKLKNGDKIKVTVDFDKDELKEYNIKLTKTEFEVEVKGLLKGEEIDVFEGLKVVYTGYDGGGYAELDESGCSDFVKENINFYISSDRYELSNGSTVTVNAYYDGGSDYDYDYNGVVDEENKVCYLFENSQTKDFTVEGLTEVAEVNVFDYVDVVYGGFVNENNVSVGLEWKEDAPDYLKDNVSFSQNYFSGVADEQVVTFEIYSWSVDDLGAEGYKPSSTTWEYTVDFDLAQKYAEAADVTADTYKEAIQKAVTDEVATYAGNTVFEIRDLGTIDEIVSVTYKATYFKVKTEKAYSWDPMNKYEQIFEVKCKNTADGTASESSFYVAGVVKDVTFAGETVSEASDIDIKVFKDLTSAAADCGKTTEEYTATAVK